MQRGDAADEEEWVEAIVEAAEGKDGWTREVEFFELRCTKVVGRWDDVVRNAVMSSVDDGSLDAIEDEHQCDTDGFVQSVDGLPVDGQGGNVALCWFVEQRRDLVCDALGC